MYNNVYQEYINNMLGTIPNNQEIFEINTLNPYSNFQEPMNNNLDLEKFYPELYKLLYPMIQTACMRNTKPITEETIDEMVRDIYMNFNFDNATILNINLTNDVTNKTKTQQTTNKTETKNTAQIKSEEREDRNIRPNNFVLNDLIRILIIRELLGRPRNTFPIRPGFPPSPGGRPPFRPRLEGYGIYEDPQMYY